MKYTIWSFSRQLPKISPKVIPCARVKKSSPAKYAVTGNGRTPPNRNLLFVAKWPIVTWAILKTLRQILPYLNCARSAMRWGFQFTSCCNQRMSRWNHRHPSGWLHQNLCRRRGFFVMSEYPARMRWILWKRRTIHERVRCGRVLFCRQPGCPLISWICIYW